MANLTISTIPFFWENFSYFQRLKIRLGFQNPQINELQEKLKRFSFSTFNKELDANKPILLDHAVAYLGDYFNPVLKQILFKKLQEATPAERAKAFAHLIHFSINSNRKKMIDTCQRIVTLDLLKETYGIKGETQSVVKGLARHMARKEDPNKKSVSQGSWQIGLPKLETFRYVPFYVINLIGMAYGVDFTEKPTSRWAAQYQLSFFRTAFTDLHWLGTLYLDYFSSARKAAWVAIGIFAALTGIYFFYKRINSFLPWIKPLKPAPSLDRHLFRNLTEEAHAGLITPSFGREKELHKVEICLSSTSNTTSPIVILLGPPGAGKTQIMDELALRISKSQTARLNDKILVVVNTADMGEKGTWSETRYHSRVDMIFEAIRGVEDDVILCFDEAHNFDKKTTERIKTKLIERKIRAIFATTHEEFNCSHLKQWPIITRSRPIEVPSLDPENTKSTLLARLNANPDILATPEAIDALLAYSATITEGAEPRKSINMLTYLIQVVHASVPQESILLPLLRRRYQSEKATYNHKLFSDWKYSFESKGIIHLEKLNLLENSIKDLEENHRKKLEIFSSIKDLKKIEIDYLKELNPLIEALTCHKDHSKEIKLLFILQIILPVLKEKIDSLMLELRGTQMTIETAANLHQAGILTAEEETTYSKTKEEEINFIIDKQLLEDKKIELKASYQLFLKNPLLFPKATELGVGRAPSDATISTKVKRKHHSSIQSTPPLLPLNTINPGIASSPPTVSRTTSMDEDQVTAAPLPKSEPSLVRSP